MASLCGEIAGEMTKQEVLKIFSDSGTARLTPDEVRVRLKHWPQRWSVYSYLLRLSGQGLLRRVKRPWGGLAYEITDRGQARLAYFERCPLRVIVRP